ncbi:MAG: HD domain-containing protein, partial [Planctomycetota bacterium]
EPAGKPADEKAPAPVPLSDLTNGQEADLFALLADRTQLTTKDGKPYWKVTFRDAKRDCTFPIWSDAPLYQAAGEEWHVGEFYKLRALYHETAYGPQLDIRRIRPVVDSDRDDGFDPAMCQRRSRFNAEDMFGDLVELARDAIGDNKPLLALVLGLLEEHKEELIAWPAAVRNHHAFAGGWLEHVRNVARHAVELGRSYATLYPDMAPPLDVGLVAAGAILHDIGKLRELQTTAVGAEYTASGSMIGHILQGRDMVREAAARLADSPTGPLDAESLLRLEHIIVSHQRLPEWGSPKPPMTPEALIVHHADDCDAKLQMMLAILAEADGDRPMTPRRNVLGHEVYRGGE